MGGFKMMLRDHMGCIYIVEVLFGLRYYPRYDYVILSTIVTCM